MEFDIVLSSRCLARAHIFEPVWSAVFFQQPSFSICEAASHAALTFGRVWAVEIRNMLVANISEPIIQVSNDAAWGGAVLTNELYSSLQTAQVQYYARVHLPISHRKSLQLGPDG